MNDETRNAVTGDQRASAGSGAPAIAAVEPQTLVAQRLRERLSELASLDANWDGYGSEPVSPEILAAASSFAGWLATMPSVCNHPPLVVPMSGGRLQFEWHRGSRSLELEFESATEIHYLQWDSATGLQQEELVASGDRQIISDLINWFAGT